jgi:hypothetical protein
LTQKAKKTPICTRMLEGDHRARGWAELHGLYPTGLCGPCSDDSFGCARCNRMLPKSENRGSYCRECRSEYNRQYVARRRGLA